MKTKASLAAIFPLLGMALQHFPGRMLGQSSLYLLHGAFAVGVTWATQHFLDSISHSLVRGSLHPATLLALILMVGCILADHGINGWQNYNSTVIHIRLIGMFQDRIHRKAGRLDAVRYESEAFLGLLEKAERAATPEGASFVIVCVWNVLFCYMPYLLVMSVYLFTLHPVLILAVFLVFIPVLLSQIMKIRLYTTLEDGTVQDRREHDYYERCILGDPAKETRILGAVGFFMDRFREAMGKITQKEWKASCHATKWDAAMKSITLMGYWGVLFLLIFLVLGGEISIGAFAAIFSSISVMFGWMDEMLADQIGGMFRKTGLITSLVEFLNLPERDGDTEKLGDGSGKVTLENVSFTYPGSEKPALQEINLTLSGEILAIVGANGAGKSTLVKLMTGIYKPEMGRVTINGLDTAKSSPKRLFMGITGVFQNHQRYKMTLGDNVRVGDMTREGDEETLSALLGRVGLAHGTGELNRMLSAEFGGVELSGGQWQRVAIARALCREHTIILLDEPTAAIDPMEEAALYELFREAARGKTAVIVTHRMSAARLADKIAVMDGGRMVEYGTHESLMAQGGLYAELFRKQAEWYQPGTNTPG